MIRRPPRSTLDRSSAASDVYKRQSQYGVRAQQARRLIGEDGKLAYDDETLQQVAREVLIDVLSVSYTHLRAHETVLDLVCRLLLEKKKQTKKTNAQYEIS